MAFVPAGVLESTRVDLRGTGVSVVTVCPGFIRNGSSSPTDDQGKPFLMELEDGVRRILQAIQQKQRMAHFPWQLSYLTKCLVHNMPGFLYAWLMSRLAARDPGFDAPGPPADGP